MVQKRKLYTSKNLKNVNSGVLNISSKVLYEKIIKEYSERIFSGQIIEYYDFYERKSYIVGGLSLLELKAFLNGCGEEYWLWEMHGNEVYFIYGWDRNTKWLSC